ncbi:YegP family protein [Pseudomonas triticicola]|uniref:YegP family protein n=1 Tax=Pseudomonas triticicola TaxID=2842345 RepID=UPI003EBFBBF0
MSGWYEVSKSSNGQFRFLLKAANAETILTSELYSSRAGADGGIASVQANSPLDERYEKKSTKDGHPYFNLKAANHQIIGSSESYSSDGACDKGIASVKANGPTKTIKDKTLPVL